MSAKTLRLVVSPPGITYITDPGQVVALIKYSDDNRLQVYAADKATAQTILGGIAVPYRSAHTVYQGDASIWMRVTLEPGTIEHFSDLGSAHEGRHLLADQGYEIRPGYPHLIRVTLPTFPVQAEYPNQTATSG